MNGGDGDGDGDGDQIDPNGTDTQYVIDTVSLPADATAAIELGRDINDDGQVDNALGGVLATLQGLDLDLQTAVTESVNMGDIILLANVRATSLDSATGVGTWVFFGENADPAPPNHLGGDASFDVSANSPTDAVLAGSISGGQLSVGPGNVSIQISFGGTSITLDLKSAQIDAGVTATALNEGKLTGAVTEDDLDNEVMPAVQETLNGIIDEGCTGVADGDDRCGCAGSTGGTIIELLDTMEMDCEVSLAEIDGVVGTFLTPDLDLDEDGTPEALSIGLGFTAIGATYDLPAGI